MGEGGGTRIIKIILAGSSESAVKAFEETAAASEATQGKVEGLGKFGELLKNPWVDVGLAVTTVAVGVGAAALHMADEYAESTSKMAAQAGITNDAAKAIGDAFLSTAFSSTFSAQQMMEAYGPVAGQLGTTEGHALSAAEALQVMSAASDLAEASGTDLNTATSSLAAVMQSYGIKASGAASASDVLFNSSRMLGVPVSDLANNVDKLHAKLGPLSPSLADTSTLMADLAKQGETGRTAMSAVSSGFSTLLGGSKATNDEVKKLGLTLYDANGNFVGMQSVITQLQPKLAGMTQQQQLAAEKNLFGASSGRELNNVILAGGAAYASTADQVTKLGAAHAGAETATDNLSSSMAKLKAGVGDLLIQLGQILAPVVKHLVDLFVANAIPALRTVFTVIQQNGPTINAVFSTLATIVGTALKVAFTSIGITVGVVIGIIKFFVPIIQTIVGVVSAVVGAIISTVQTVAPVFQAVFAVVVGVVKVAFNVISLPVGIFVALVKTSMAIVVGVIQAIAGPVKTVADVVGGIFAGIANGIGSAFGAVAGIVGKAMDAAKDVIKSAINDLIGIVNWMIDKIDSLQIHFGGGPGGIGKFDWNGFGIPKIPTLDTGGLVMGPTVAALSLNSVPEVVAPLPDYLKTLRMAGMSGGAGRPIVIEQQFILNGNDTELLEKVQQIVEANNDDLARAIGQRAA